MSGRRFSAFARGALASCVVALAFAAGCSTPTSTTQLWRAPVAPDAAMSKILVFGSGMTETGRRSTEDRFVAALAERGITAKQSYVFFPQQPPDKEAARDAAKTAGFDGALVAKLRSVRDAPVYVPDADPFWGGYYGGYYGGSVVTEEIVNVETTLWDLRAGGRMVWSATTRTENPSSGADAAKSLTKELVPKLADSGLLVPSR